jgi:hypothetical protein
VLQDDGYLRHNLALLARLFASHAFATVVFDHPLPGVGMVGGATGAADYRLVFLEDSAIDRVGEGFGFFQQKALWPRINANQRESSKPFNHKGH